MLDGHTRGDQAAHEGAAALHARGATEPLGVRDQFATKSVEEQNQHGHHATTQGLNTTQWQTNTHTHRANMSF
jgi:hypothetical protein